MKRLNAWQGNTYLPTNDRSATGNLRGRVWLPFVIGSGLIDDVWDGVRDAGSWPEQVFRLVAACAATYAVAATALWLTSRRPAPAPDPRCTFSLAASDERATVTDHRCVLFAEHRPAVPHRDQWGNETNGDHPIFITR